MEAILDSPLAGQLTVLGLGANWIDADAARLVADSPSLGGLAALGLLWCGERWLPGRPVALGVVALSIAAVSVLGLTGLGVRPEAGGSIILKGSNEADRRQRGRARVTIPSAGEAERDV